MGVEHKKRGCVWKNHPYHRHKKNAGVNRISYYIKTTFEHNENLRCIYMFKGTRLIFIKRNDALMKKISQDIFPSLEFP